MEDPTLDQHSPGRADLHDRVSASDIRSDVDNTNVFNPITENNDVISTIEPYLHFWPDNEDPWGEKTVDRPLIRASSQPELHSSSRS